MTGTAIHEPHSHLTAAGIRINYVPRNEGALVQITLDGTTHGRFYNHHQRALDVYRALVAEHDAPLAVDDQTVTTVGRVVVTVQRVRADVFTVTTYQGTLRAEQWCWSYPTQADADQARKHTIAAFEAHGTIDAIEAAAEAALADYNRSALRRDRESVRRTTAATAVMSRLANLHELAQLADIADDLAKLDQAA